MPPTKTGRPKTGSVTYVKAKPGEKWGHYLIRVTCTDGSRLPKHLNPGPETEEAEKNARDLAKEMTEEFAKRRRVVMPQRMTKGNIARAEAAKIAEGETVAEYAERWFGARAAAGLKSAADDRGRFKKWIAPVLGPRPVAKVARVELEAFVSILDDHVRAERCAWKTAENTWGLVTKMFDDARRSKTLALRVRDDNPCADVRGPDRGTRVAKVYVFPSELSALMQCEEVPLPWRRLVVVAVYTYLRAGELRALQWEDVDLEHRRIHVHRSDEGSTKSDAARTVPIEPALLPLLEAMRDESGGAGHVLAKGLITWNAPELLRLYLKSAGVVRAELFDSTKTRRRLRFHDLRATGITWRAVRGDEPLKIMHAAGHAEFDTTMAYIRTADELREGFGAVFPELPAAGFRSENRSMERKHAESNDDNAGGAPAGARPPSAFSR